MKMQKIYNKNHIVKIACICSAFLLWVFVMYEMNPIDKRVITSVPVNITNLDKMQNINLVQSVGQNFAANVEIQGRRSILSSISKENIKLEASIDTPTIGINNAMISLSNGNKDVEYRITPEYLEVSLEKLDTKNMNVSVNATGLPVADANLSKITIHPQHVFIKGPATQVQKVNKVQCEINLENTSESFSKWADLKILDSDGKEVEGVKSTDTSAIVDVDISIKKKVPIDIHYSSENFILPQDYQIDEQEVEITGESSLIKGIQSISTQVVDVSRLSSESVVRVELKVPEDVNTSINYITIINNKKDEKSASLKFTSDDIIVKDNKDKELNDSIKSNIVIPDEVSVNISFKEGEEIDYLNKDNYKLYLDLNKYDKDTNTIPLDMQTSLDNDGYTLSPDKITVELTETNRSTREN